MVRSQGRRAFAATAVCQVVAVTGASRARPLSGRPIRCSRCRGTNAAGSGHSVRDASPSASGLARLVWLMSSTSPPWRASDSPCRTGTCGMTWPNRCAAACRARLRRSAASGIRAPGCRTRGRRRMRLAGRAWPVASPFAGHKQSTGLLVPGFSLDPGRRVMVGSWVLPDAALGPGIDAVAGCDDGFDSGRAQGPCCGSLHSGYLADGPQRTDDTAVSRQDRDLPPLPHRHAVRS